MLFAVSSGDTYGYTFSFNGYQSWINQGTMLFECLNTNLPARAQIQDSGTVVDTVVIGISGTIYVVRGTLLGGGCPNMDRYKFKSPSIKQSFSKITLTCYLLRTNQVRLSTRFMASLRGRKFVLTALTRIQRTILPANSPTR